MADETYNGWTNYETWAVKLWIDNEQSSQEYWLAAAKLDTGRGYDLAKQLQDEHEELIPDAVNGTVFADLLNAALGSVNWDEIARSLIKDAAEING